MSGHSFHSLRVRSAKKGTLKVIQYDDYAENTERAFDAFARIYSLTHPPPKPPASRRGITWSTVGLTVVTVAAVLVSGDRTIDEFGGWPRGVTAFVMLEVASIVIGFFLTKLMPDGAHSKKLLVVALIFIIFIMVGANFHAVFRSAGWYVDPRILTVILLAVAISAPVLTAINGHLTAVEWKFNSRQRQLDMNAYEARLARWRDGLSAEWNNSKEKRSASIQIQKPQPSSQIVPSIPMERGMERVGQGGVAGFPKTSDAMEQALAFYRSNLELLDADPRTIPNRPAGKSTMYAARKQVIEETRNGK